MDSELPLVGLPLMVVAERINQLGGTPNFNPDGLLTRSVSQYSEGGNVIGMIRELIRYFADDDPATRTMIEGILSVAEEHANDMHDLLIAHEGTRSLASH